MPRELENQLKKENNGSAATDKSDKL